MSRIYTVWLSPFVNHFVNTFSAFKFRRPRQFLSFHFLCTTVILRISTLIRGGGEDDHYF